MKAPSPIAGRFWSKVATSPDGCWLWQGRISRTGYGHFFVATVPGVKKLALAHRMAWALTNGEIPAGLFVCHRCDVRACVRPDHLFLGTNTDNMRDASRKGRTLRGERAPNSRLTDEAVSDIRRRVAAGEMQRVVAADYGTDQSYISQIVHGRVWKHLPLCALLLCLFSACDRRVVGWDPASLRCREFDGATFVGPFLKDEVCAGQSKPVEIHPEVQP